MKYLNPLLLNIVLLISSHLALAQNTISVYPNPTVDTININYNTAVFTRFDLDLFDVTGQILWSPISDSVHWPGNYEIKHDVSFFQNGVYFFVLTSSTGEIQTTKFVKKGPVSISELTGSQFLVYPNPTQKLINFPEGFKELNIFDLFGKKVMSVETPMSQVDVSFLKNGLYIIELIGGSSKRVVIEIQK
jgi:hypothetical protein